MVFEPSNMTYGPHTASTAEELQQDIDVRKSIVEVPLPYVTAATCVLAVVGLLLLAWCGYRFLVNRRFQFSSDKLDDSDNPTHPLRIKSCTSKGLGGSNVTISQSTPDIVEGSVENDTTAGDDKKGILRQTTLPTLSQRHEQFQRQLSHKLDLDFQICSIHRKEQPDLGQLKPELYKCSLSTQSSSSDLVCGRLTFSLRYSQDDQVLVVTIIKAEDLPPKDFSSTCDPYIKVYLLPDRKRKCQTRVHRKTQNPEFNESFQFAVQPLDLAKRTLQFSMYDFDRFSRHDLIGQVVMKDLYERGELSTDKFYTMDILSAYQDKVDLGEVMISLCYLPTAGRLTGTVIKARNLKPMDITGSSGQIRAIFHTFSHAPYTV